MPAPGGPPPVTGGTPDRPLAGIGAADVREVEPSADLAERRQAVAELGDALRELTARLFGDDAGRTR